jgi:hypothetical protein
LFGKFLPYYRRIAVRLALDADLPPGLFEK